MKKLSIILLVLSLFMTLTQCKKNDFHVAPETNNEVVYIRLNVNNGSKIDVNTTNGDVNFEKYDQIYVVSNGKYVGTLSHDGESFYGAIEGAVENEYLYFYFFGNQKIETLKVGESISCSVNIEDQSKKLPVISCGQSYELFKGEGSYSVFLFNKCALVKFNVSTSSDKEMICLSGLNNNVDIDFTNSSFAYSQVDGGIIKLGEGSGEHWAILFPSEAMEEGAEGTAFSADYRYTGRRPAMNAIGVNDFVTEAYDFSIETATVSDGMFTMGASKRIIFAPGNVQYIGSAETPYWKFADHQYDVLSNTDEQNSAAENVDRDRFGWGTGDYPNNVSNKNANYSTFVDWGDKFTAVDGHEWHSPRCYEWKYVLYERNATKLNGVYNARYARATIETDGKNKVYGLIIFPDVYNHPDDVELPAAASINYTTDNQHLGYEENVYTVAEWEKMEAAGAAFLPAGGQRIYKDESMGFYELNEGGHYWSQCTFNEGFACNMFFTDYRPYVFDDNDRYKGFSVRLVHE
ncbi:MAG: hypothetical protein IKS65_08200 [Bacteroidales bacterium]|nr:hypothetical protein [Bacteroidales bacterium]